MNFLNGQLLIDLNLTHHTETVNEYVNIVVQLLHILKVHSYISKCQSRYLKKLKSEIYSSAELFLGDFAENYRFLIQYEVPGVHSNNSQCTLHPVITYYQENDEMKNISYCVISDDRKHDVALVYEVQKAILADLKYTLPGLLIIIILMGVLDGTKIRKIFIIFVSTKVTFD